MTRTNPLQSFRDERLIAMAVAYALDAAGEAERLDLEARLRCANATTRQAFDIVVTQVRETMALVSSATATPPSIRLREQILDAIVEIESS